MIRTSVLNKYYCDCNSSHQAMNVVPIREGSPLLSAVALYEKNVYYEC